MKPVVQVRSANTAVVNFNDCLVWSWSGEGEFFDP